VLTCMQEAGTGFASKAQTDDAEAGGAERIRACEQARRAIVARHRAVLMCAAT